MAKSPNTIHIGESQAEHLIGSILQLRDEVHVLREAIDELREELQYLVRNPDHSAAREQLPRLRVTSLASDPTAEDFGERINVVPKEKLDELRENAILPPTQQQASSQGRLF